MSAEAAAQNEPPSGQARQAITQELAPRWNREGAFTREDVQMSEHSHLQRPRGGLQEDKSKLCQEQEGGRLPAQLRAEYQNHSSAVQDRTSQQVTSKPFAGKEANMTRQNVTVWPDRNEVFSLRLSRIGSVKRRPLWPAKSAATYCSTKRES